MKIEKAKEIQDIMTTIERDAKILFECQISAGAAILRSITCDEDNKIDLSPSLWGLLTAGRGLGFQIDDLIDVVEEELGQHHPVS